MMIVFAEDSQSVLVNTFLFLYGEGIFRTSSILRVVNSLRSFTHWLHALFGVHKGLFTMDSGHGLPSFSPQ